MGDSAKKKTIRFDSLLCQNPHRQSTLWVLDSGPEAAGPVHQSHAGPAPHCNRAASGDIDANVSCDAILQHSDARS